MSNNIIDKVFNMYDIFAKANLVIIPLILVLITIICIYAIIVYFKHVDNIQMQSLNKYLEAQIQEQMEDLATAITEDNDTN